MSFTAPSLARHTTIAILVDNKPLFSSGIIQQTLFTFQCLSLIPNCQISLVSTDPQYNQFGQETGLFPQLDIIHLSAENLESVLANTQIFICLSGNLNSDKSALERIRALGIKLIECICGNYYILDQERFALGQHSSVHFYENSQYFDEYWLLPMYDFARAYIETLTHKPVHLVPYVWGSDVIEAWIEKHSASVDIRWGLSSHSPETLPTILIAEPNLSIHKTALVPFAICERYHQDGNQLNTVLCLASLRGDASDESRRAILSHLSIYQNGLVELYPRMQLPGVLQQLALANKQPIIVSHQIMNDLNFLHLELLHLGYPLVHNCKRLSSVGFYYEGCDPAQGARQLEICVNPSAARPSSQSRELAQHFLQQFAPSNPSNVEAYARRISQVLEL